MPLCGKHDILSILYVFNPNDILTSARMIWEKHKTGATEPQFHKNGGWNEKSGYENSTQWEKTSLLRGTKLVYSAKFLTKIGSQVTKLVFSSKFLA
jgi:hypothetical protein